VLVCITGVGMRGAGNVRRTGRTTTIASTQEQLAVLGIISQDTDTVGFTDTVAYTGTAAYTDDGEYTADKLVTENSNKLTSRNLFKEFTLRK
jgi:hypothetical protein